MQYFQYLNIFSDLFHAFFHLLVDLTKSISRLDKLLVDLTDDQSTNVIKQKHSVFELFSVSRLYRPISRLTGGLVD